MISVHGDEKDGPTQSTTIEVKVEEPRSPDDPSREAVSSSDVIAMKIEDLTYPLIYPLSPATTTRRHQRKSYNRSSLHRSARLAQCNVLKDLDIVGNDVKLDEGVIQEYAECLKQLLPPDLLKSLTSLKGHAS
uniref:Uncharacterized protein n=1 Tax=Arundo donax TaxID=35708 RepID=A0A0A8Y6N5_ARUDO